MSQKLTTMMFAMQLKQWYREGTGHEETIAGTVEYDKTGYYKEGEFFSVTRPTIKHITEYNEYFALKTSIYILLRKEDEIL